MSQVKDQTCFFSSSFWVRLPCTSATFLLHISALLHRNNGHGLIWYLTHLVQYGITVSEEYFEEATPHRLETEVSRHSDLTNPITGKHYSLICMLRVLGLQENDDFNFMLNELYTL